MSELAPWQESVLDSATQLLADGRLAHGLLLYGPPAMGKREVAEALAKRLLCPTPDARGRACGQCRSCRQFEQRSQRDPVETRPDGSLAQPNGHPGHPDVVFLGYVLNEKGSSKKMRTELVVDQVRELGQWFALTASQGVAQVAIIEPADQLNDNAANALLKTLEEPSSNRYLLLVTDNPGRLPATVLSRCQRLEFRIPEPAVARQWLRDRGIADADACEALDAARGHPGLAAEWLAQGGLALRQEVKSDLEQIAAGRGSPVTTAQRWLADDSADLRLRFAADLALEAGKRQSAGMGRIGDWFNAVGRCRMQLRAPLRHDLVLAGLLHEWGNMFRRAG